MVQSAYRRRADVPGAGRPDPPPDMPDDEAEVWRTVVDGMPSGSFGGPPHGVLGLYCFHMALAKTAIEEVRELKARLRRGGRPNVEVVASLKHSEVIARRESSQVANLAQKLRIT